MKDMLGRGEARSVETALAAIASRIPTHTPQSETIAIEHALGRILASDLRSTEDMPGFARSTVDGYAVASVDTFGATETNPAYMRVAHEILMAEEPRFALGRGEAAKIATGGMLPSGADAVLMLEDAVRLDETNIEALRALAPAENVIQRGEDVRDGDLVLQAGHKIRPQDMAVLAGLGHAQVSVYKRPIVSIISTGDEIVPPETSIRPGLVRDMNSYNLAGLIAEHGGVPVMRGIFRDDFAAIRDEFSRAVKESQMVLITGGSSVGARDMTARIMAGQGEILFHSVAMRPGKPLIAGVAGDSSVPAFGLPGHPRAVTVCFMLFVRPVLLMLTGHKPREFEGYRARVSARLLRSVSSVAGRRDVISVSLSEVDGALCATPVRGKSGLIAMLVKADGVISIPPDKMGVGEGERVEVELF